VPASESPAEKLRRAVDIQVDGSAMCVIVQREFDSGNLHQDWAHSVIALHPGPFKQVTVDAGLCGLLSSTFFAGLIHLHQYYVPRGSAPIILRHPDPRVVRNLKTLRLDRALVIEPRPAA
jgi:hypothetical protein